MTVQITFVASDHAPSVFESFNARNLSPNQVAMRFIPPSHFDDLVLRRHSLVVGPRGSGKTTLLKMLQLPALASWTHEEANRYRAQIDFTGVFIAADVSWGAQIQSLSRRAISPDISRILGIGAFTTHVLIALLESMRDTTSNEVRNATGLTRQFVHLTKELEATLVYQLSTNWKLTPLIQSLHGLKLALRNRLSEISQLARSAQASEATAIKDLLPAASYIHIDFLDAVIFGVEAFNEIANAPQRKWALCFDELEIAPTEIRQVLFRALRSTDQRLIFKLSLSPYHEDADLLHSAISAMPGQDYQPIELWYPKKEDGYPFCNSLLRSMLREFGSSTVDADEVFGPSEFESAEESVGNNRSAYRPGTRIHKRYLTLANRDPTFMAYLRENNIELDKMHQLSEIARAGAVRKVASLVAVREAYRSGPVQVGGTLRTERSRKNPTLYTGAKSLFAITEGNPRWLIGMMEPLLRQYVEGQKIVPRSKQARTIATASSRFRALLRTIPFNPAGSELGRVASGSRGLLTLLDAIGGAFHENVVVKPFVAEPVLSFTVDSNTSPELLLALGRALNSGAIILAPDENSEALLSSLRGKRFRLSYLLAPEYKIPLTLGRTLSLSQLLHPRDAGGPLLRWTQNDAH